MPLFRQAPFERRKIPKHLPIDVPLFYCSITDEVFTDYEEFCYRIVQCNAMEWTCAETGRTNLSYSEAMESEINAQKMWARFPEVLKVPALLLASNSQSSDFHELLCEIYSFMNCRFFVNETVMPRNKCEKWKQGTVLTVKEPIFRTSSKSSKKAQDSDYTPGECYMYEVNVFDGEIGQIYRTRGEKLKRPPDTLFAINTLSAFLKHNAEQDSHGIWIMKDSVMQQYNIKYLKFNDIFVGEPPVFSNSSKNQSRQFDKEVMCKNTEGHSSHTQSSFVLDTDETVRVTEDGNTKMKEISKSRSTSIKRKRLDEDSDERSKIKKRKTTILHDLLTETRRVQNTQVEREYMDKQCEDLSIDTNEESNSNDDSTLDAWIGGEHCESDDDIEVVWSNIPSSHLPANYYLSNYSAEKEIFIEETTDVRGRDRTFSRRSFSNVENLVSAQFSKTGRRQHLAKDKKKNWLEKQRAIEVRERAKKEEKEKRRKAKEEQDKLKWIEIMKEWKKVREDMLCDDLKPLPVPCDINCRISNELFGDFMMVLEFFHSFNSIIKVDSFFPINVTFDYLERALVDIEVAGPLVDIIQTLLLAIFDLQITEVENLKKINLAGLGWKYDNHIHDLQVPDGPSIAATGWCDNFLGIPLHRVPLNYTTISEVLRLHLLCSGVRPCNSASRWLCQQGGFTDLDDPGLHFRIENPSIILELSHKHICELSVVDKLGILGCLLNQILTYSTIQNNISESFEKVKEAKLNLRSLQKEVVEQQEANYIRIQKKKERKTNSTTCNSEGDGDNGTLQFKAEMSKLESQIQVEASKILPLVKSQRLLPIGADRAHRNFWMFSSLPGLFVEYNAYEIGPCLPEATTSPYELSDTLASVRQLFEGGEEEESNRNCSDKENNSTNRDISKCQPSSGKKLFGGKERLLDSPRKEFLMCTASENCPVHHPPSLKSRWCFFSKEKDVPTLLESLNIRGIRESALHRLLFKDRQRIKESIGLCPIHKLNPVQFQSAEREPSKSTYINDLKGPLSTSVNSILESTLRKYLLELESSLTLECRGALKVRDRETWRTAMLNGKYDKQCYELLWGFDVEIPRKMVSLKKVIMSPKKKRKNLNLSSRKKKKRVVKENTNEIDETEHQKTLQDGGNSEDHMGDGPVAKVSKDQEENLKNSVTSQMGSQGNEHCVVNPGQSNENSENCNASSTPSTSNPIIRDLASALLQLGQSVDPKFLKKPLANDGSTTLQIKLWEVSLMKSINFAQLFIHLSTLEESIKWRRRDLCNHCGRRFNIHNVLHCVGCKKKYHIYCVQEKLRVSSTSGDISRRNWYCSSCTTNEVDPIEDGVKIVN